MIEAIEAELRRLGMLDEGIGQGVVVRPEVSGVARVLDDGAGEAIVRSEEVLAALKRVASGSGPADMWAALASAELNEPTECNGCNKLYESAEGTGNATGSRFCPDCSARNPVAAS